MLRLWFTPYVQASYRRFSGCLLIEPKEQDARLTLSVGMESGDVTQQIREVRPFRTDAPAGRWFAFDCPIDERFTDWRDLAVVSVYVEIQSDKPGLAASIDDVRVGSGDQRVGSRQARRQEWSIR